jgi:AraC-like DNA-binding protein
MLSWQLTNRDARIAERRQTALPIAAKRCNNFFTIIRAWARRFLTSSSVEQLLQEAAVAKQHDVVTPILGALAQHRGDLTAAEAATLVGRSTSRVRHQFTRTAAMTFRTARLRAKLDYGVLLLRTTTLSIPDISALLGYSDRTKFEKSMKRLYGLTPTQYRQAERGIAPHPVIDPHAGKHGSKNTKVRPT